MRLTIIHHGGPRAGTQQSVSGKEKIRLGRRPDNDYVFDKPEDVEVSGHHAEIRIVDGLARIADLYSTNGTFVNGQRIEDSELQPKDMVQLGPGGPRFQVEYARPTIQPPPDSAVARGAPRKVAAPAAPQQHEGWSESPPTREQAAPATPTAPQPAPGSAAAPSAPAPPADIPEPAPAPAASPPPAAPAAGGEEPPKKYGERTVGMMIKQALEHAEAAPKQGTTKSTEYFEALMDKKVKSTSSRLKWIIVAVVGTLLIAGAIFGYYLWRNRSVSVVQQYNYGDVAGGTIASTNRYNVFMLAGLPTEAGAFSRAKLQGFCTGFAVSADLLATNAHCVKAANANFSQVWALMNGAPDHQYPVIKMVAHPGYTEDSISPDVALMRIQGRLTSTVTIANATELTQVAPGVPVFLYGFPGRLNKEDAPEATFIKGDIGRVTAFDQKLGDFGHNTLLQHSAYSTGGTSGSPMFNAGGHVIGVNAGGYVERGEVLHGYNFGMRIDLVQTLYPLIASQ